MTIINNKKWEVVFAAIGTFLLTFKFMSYGYLMTLDAIYGPITTRPNLNINFFSNTVWQYINYSLGQTFGTMIVEKIFLVCLFFCLFYFPLKFFPFEVKEKYKYLGAIFFVINPFVLERFLAGQWGVLAGYALLYPFLYYLVKLIRNYKIENLYKLFLACFLVGVFSFHLFVMANIIMFCALALTYKRSQNLKLAKLLEALVGYFLLNLYWVYPYLTVKQTILNSFNENHFESFVTNVLNVGVWSPLSVFTLYGFWGERELWAQQFGIVAFSNLLFIIPIVILSFYGVYCLYKKEKAVGIVVGVSLILAAIFSLGISNTFFKPVNQFLFDNISFWSGFRDSQKWLAIVALVLAASLPVGASRFLEREKPADFRNLLFWVLFIFPIIYSWSMLVLFWIMLKPVDYPQGWYQVNAILQQENNCKAVFLPWHQYYFLPFNQDILTGNPAGKFFDCQVYTSLDAEFGNIGIGFEVDAHKNSIQKIMDSDMDPGDMLEKLKSEGINYLVVTENGSKNMITNNLEKALENGNFEPRTLIEIYRTEDIVLYKF